MYEIAIIIIIICLLFVVYLYKQEHFGYGFNADEYYKRTPIYLIQYTTWKRKNGTSVYFEFLDDTHILVSGLNQGIPDGDESALPESKVYDYFHIIDDGTTLIIHHGDDYTSMFTIGSDKNVLEEFYGKKGMRMVYIGPLKYHNSLSHLRT